MATSKSILIAERAKATQQTLAFLLHNRGYQVHQASNGKEALESARTTAPDLVIVGGELQGLSGYDLYRLLKMDPAASQVPILLLVAATDMADAPTRTLPDPKYLLSKPFTAHDFLRRVGDLLSEAPEPTPFGGA